MILYKPEVAEVVIARFTNYPSERQIDREWAGAARAEQVGKEFPRRNMTLRAVDGGYELVVRRTARN